MKKSIHIICTCSTLLLLLSAHDKAFATAAQPSIWNTGGYEHNEAFSFEIIIDRTERLFEKIDELGRLPLESLGYTEVEIGDSYEVESTFEGAFPRLLTLFVIFAPVIIAGIVIGITIWTIVKWNKIGRGKKEKGNNPDS